MSIKHSLRCRLLEHLQNPFHFHTHSMKNFKFGKKTTVTKLIMKCLPDVEMSFRKIQ